MSFSLSNCCKVNCSNNLIQMLCSFELELTKFLNVFLDIIFMSVFFIAWIYKSEGFSVRKLSSEQ